MTEEELKKKCKERAKIFQQAMESCHSNNLIDCIEWFADKIAELEKDKQYFSDSLDKQIEATLKLQQENAELKEESDFYNKERGNYKALYLKEVLKKQKAKEIMNIAIEGIKHWGIVGGTERPFEKQAEKLFNLFLDKAEQFLSEVDK